MHEAGHVFGFGHPHTRQAVMFWRASGWLEQFCKPTAYDVVNTMAKYQSR